MALFSTYPTTNLFPKPPTIPPIVHSIALLKVISTVQLSKHQQHKFAKHPDKKETKQTGAELNQAQACYRWILR